MTLEELITKAAKRGELSHLSIGFSPRGVFSVSYRGASAGHYAHGEDADPIKALKAVLNLSARSAKPETELEDWES